MTPGMLNLEYIALYKVSAAFFAFADFTWMAKPYLPNSSTIVRTLNFACALVSMAKKSILNVCIGCCGVIRCSRGPLLACLGVLAFWYRSHVSHTADTVF